MIGRLSGIVAHKAADHVLLDVRGVGYVVHVGDRTLAALPPEGEAATLYTELLVREDLLQLFGFLSPVEKDWHRLLVTVQGVGPRVALAVLGALGPDGLGRAIALGDARALQAAPGVGARLASRIVLELKAKAPALMALGGAGPRPAPPAAGEETPAPPARRRASPPLQPAPDATADALSALANLGYGPQDAARAVAEAADEDPAAPAASLIRAALRRLAPR